MKFVEYFVLLIVGLGGIEEDYLYMHWKHVTTHSLSRLTNTNDLKESNLDFD